MPSSRPAAGKGAYDTFVSLRTWQRLKKRAEELNATVPDPSVLVVVLDRMCKPVITADTNIAFRVSAFRFEREVDTVPTYDKVDAFARVLLAELEGAVGNESQLSKKDRVALLKTEENKDGKGEGKNKDPPRPKDPPKSKAEGAEGDQPPAKGDQKGRPNPSVIIGLQRTVALLETAACIRMTPLLRASARIADQVDTLSLPALGHGEGHMIQRPIRLKEKVKERGNLNIKRSQKLKCRLEKVLNPPLISRR